ncbi:MAG TPA: hypothetical protein VK829_01640 [Terriglobales bacterium]|jgi:hypothetical protein|nr:hypothetical protein [Terriglobales bacterium]
MKLENPDFQLLYDSLFAMAKKLLQTQGAFLPIGRIVSPDGKIAYVIANTKEEQPGAHIALQLLESGLRDMAAKGTCRAAGIALDTRLKSGDWKDAIWMTLEETAGKSQSLIVPYAKSWMGGFKFADPSPGPENHRIFAPKQ